MPGIVLSESGQSGESRQPWHLLDLYGMMHINSGKVQAEGNSVSSVLLLTLNLSLNLTFEERGRPVSTGILRSAVHVELSGSRKSSGKM